MKDYLNLIDTNTPGPRCDVTPLFTSPESFSELIADLVKPFEKLDIKYVAGIDALGFILGTAVALHLSKGFITIRKGGKLPVPVLSCQFTDYTGLQKALEIRTDIIKSGDSILLIDEWIETGAQITAAVALLEDLGAEVVGIATINIDDCSATRRLQEKYTCHSLW
jgi:adenine phosphoribosyltransferase